MFARDTSKDDSDAFDRHTVIWRWVVEDDAYQDPEGIADIADEYAVLRIDNPVTVPGLMVMARYGDRWQANPWSVRPVVHELLRRLGELEHD